MDYSPDASNPFAQPSCPMDASTPSTIRASTHRAPSEAGTEQSSTMGDKGVVQAQRTPTGVSSRPSHDAGSGRVQARERECPAVTAEPVPRSATGLSDTSASGHTQANVPYSAVLGAFSQPQPPATTQSPSIHEPSNPDPQSHVVTRGAQITEKEGSCCSCCCIF